MSNREVLSVVGLLVVAVLATGVVSAHAEPVQQFTFQVAQARVDAPASFHMKMRVFDTTGAVPPTLEQSYVRLPRGVDVRREFLDGRWFCDGPALRDALDRHPSATPFTRRIANLRPFIRELARGGRRDRGALANARTCERARLGGGTGLIDARNVVRVFTEPIPVRFTAFLSRGERPGATAGFAILGAAAEDAPIARRYPALAGVHAALDVSFMPDPTPDGLYGYKVLLPTGPINGFAVSVAEVDATVRSLLLPKGSCRRRGAGGRCTARRRTALSSFVVPACPPSGSLSAELFSAWAPPTPSLTTTLQLPCPSYRP